MMPIGPLMVEHRWIERLITDLKLRLDGQSPAKGIDSVYVDRVIDFLGAYADRCHHGKEEGILFHELDKKKLDPVLKDMMLGLIDDHRRARATAQRLATANISLATRDVGTLDEVKKLLGELVTLYPRHIQTEEDDFFRPAMAYFSQEQQTAMLEAFTRFDATLIHEKYRGMARDLAGES